MRYELPQPYEEMDHTADVGVIVHGVSAEETVARLVLAMSALLTGGGPIHPAPHAVTITAERGERIDMALDLLRELLFIFDCDHRIASGCEVTRFDREQGATMSVWLAPWDEEAHEEGTELKAVTLHEARFEPEGDGWRAQIVFDV